MTMAGKRTRVRRDDWSVIATEDAGGEPALRWACSLNGDSVLLRAGVHPMEAAEDQILEAQLGAPAPAPAAADVGRVPTATERIAAMLLSARSTASARVRLEKFMADGSLAFCADYSPDEWERGDLPMVRAKFGAGRFAFTLFDGNRRTMIGSSTIEILPLGDPDLAGAAGGMERAVEQIMQRIDRIEAARALPSPVVAADPKAQFAEMLELAAQFKAIFAPPPAAAPPPPPDPVAQLTQLVTLNRGVQDLAREITPAPVPEDPLLALGPEVLKVIGQAIAAQKPAPAPALPHVALPPSMARPAAPPAAGPQSNGHAPPTDDDAMADKALRQGLTVLNGLAAMPGEWIEQGAHLVYEQVDDETIDLLREPGWFDFLVSVSAQCAPHRAWYEKVRELVLQWRAEDARGDVPGSVAANG
jgi:hypothetical protein